jgi:phage/conjugal plasmid C-4 type zinc finger TraR family protein
MAGGWAKDGAIQDQIDASVEDAVNRARSELTTGQSLHECEECGAKIPDARRKAVAGVRRCIECQGASESKRIQTGSINRRASKDSQLR